MSLILAIDQSTSATKAILFDARGRILDKASRAHRQIYPRPGWVEHDAEEIWQNVLAVVRALARRNSAKFRKLAGLSITNQRETVVVFDRKTGRPLRHALVWQDRRGDAICAKLRAQGHENAVRDKTGLKIDTYFSASKLKWLISSEPQIAAKLRNGDAAIGTVDSYLIYRLTNGEVFATDYTNASRTLLFNTGTLAWDKSLCKLFRIPIHALPEVRESSALFGRTDVTGVLQRPTPITGVMGDSQASLFAQKCFQPGTAKATFGSGTSVLLNTGNQRHTTGRGAVSALAWVLNGKPTYALEGIINFSAATIEWLKNQLGLIRDHREIEKLAASVESNGGVYLVPAFAGLSAPYWSSDARAAIVGMTAYTRREHVIRAALEAIAYQIRDVLDMMRTEANINLKQLHADGGPTRNRFLMQFTTDLTRAKIEVSGVAELSAWGAAMNGLLGLGVCKSLKELTALPAQRTVFTAKMSSRLADENYAGWRLAVQRVL